MARGVDTGNHPNRQVGAHRWNAEDPSDDGEGPPNDDWIHKAYYNQAGPNPDYRGKSGGS